MRFVFIGGIGGSGTRVVAKIVKGLRFHIGSNVNASLDNLDWPGNRELLLDSSKSEEFRHSQMAPAFRAFADNMVNTVTSDRSDLRGAATKVPGSFYYLPYLARYFDDIRYIHVIRHGLDMAFSQNRNQFKNWGSFFELSPTTEISPGDLLRYWVLANRYAIQACDAHLPGRHLMIRYEDLCSNVAPTVDRIAAFIGADTTPRLLKNSASGVAASPSLGRYRISGGPEMFNSNDVDAVKTFGYDVEW